VVSKSGRAGLDWFRRFILPGLAFKAIVIGGGYATGRELVEFFMASGPWGGVLGMMFAAAVWSVVAALTFAYARLTHSLDYRHFFQQLLGRFWILFEIGFLALLVVILAVFGAAAGSLGQALFGTPLIAGTLLLMILIAGFAAFGNESVEELFKYVSFLLYGVYALFLALALTRFGTRIEQAFADPHIGRGWLSGGLAYSGYNIVGAVLILPVVRHMRSMRDALVAGILAGPLAMAPALLFFVCLAAWPTLSRVALPSDFLLAKLGFPAMRWAFQLMIFAALLESGTGSVHAFNQRIAGTLGRDRPLGWPVRLALSLGLLVASVFLADRFGLVQLIAHGYRLLSYAFLGIYVVPLLTLGLWRIVHLRRAKAVN
jgi:uncharacterized membrane protein YkvI